MAAIDQRISVIGLGYVDLPVATTFARSGNPVVAFDIDARRFRRPNSNSRTGVSLSGAGYCPVAKTPISARRRPTRPLLRRPERSMPAASQRRRDLGKVVPELRRIRQTVNERRAADRAGNLGECLRHYRPTHDDAKETRCRSTPPG